MYGKQTETAIAAVSRLAEVYDGGTTRISAGEIARHRALQPPFVAKVLTVLSQAGLVTGSPGPGGGYTLARPPAEITIYDIYSLFEREDDSDVCPFGGGTCGVGEKCPLHDRLVAVQAALDELLHETTFAEYEGRRAGRQARPGATGKKRESYRAPKARRPGGKR